LKIVALTGEFEKKMKFKILIAILLISLSILSCKIERVESLEIEKTPTKIVALTPTCTEDKFGYAFTNVDEGLNLREKANENSKILAVILPNQKVKILSNQTESGWICVEHRGVIGWVNAKYIIREDLSK
jgi:uncharacterized protein YgiM (DUF1202 family)